MKSTKKCSSDVRKYRTRHKYRGKRHKPLRKATAGNDACDAPVRPTADIGHHDIGNRDSCPEIDAAVEFVSASKKKIEFFKSEPRSASASAAGTVLCEICALTALVVGSACPTCRERKLAVREAAEKRKGLSSFLELRCDNAECPESVVSFTHTSKPINSAGECGDPGANIRYEGGSSRDGFAVNVKAVLAARDIGAGHDQLSRFCAIIGLPKPLHQKTFHGVAKKLHCAAMKAVSQNLDEARRVTRDAVVGGGDVLVMLDGTWQKRGHKSHNGVGTAVSLDIVMAPVATTFALLDQIRGVNTGVLKHWGSLHHATPPC
ncbi:hypothetical protein HPB50_024692 [Hyalomma asiaticum]|uniref:Uncharacterized protein n=1 Tax=Hyalomma asiaticum TaxID=266040 RepID=A0ACB7TN60_HYAAI|nr:hypothetical protein HPB50_024692 [Hyalomma asiaticum]